MATGARAAGARLRRLLSRAFMFPDGASGKYRYVPHSRTESVTAGEDIARAADRSHERPGPAPLRWLTTGLSRVVSRMRARASALAHMIRKAISRAVNRLSTAVSSPVRLIKSLLAMLMKDRGFGFRWLVVMAAIALAIGLLVTVLLSPVLGLLAALIAAIWMLVRRARSTRSGQTAQAQPAS